MKNIILLALFSVTGSTALPGEGSPGLLAPWLAKPAGRVIEEGFVPGAINDRWFFTEWWTAREGVLLRNELAGENKRLFWKKPSYKDAVISLDFSFRGAEEIRLMSGTPGKYNFVVRLCRGAVAIGRSGYFQPRHADGIQRPCAPDRVVRRDPGPADSLAGRRRAA